MKSIIFNQHQVNRALKNKKGMFRVVNEFGGNLKFKRTDFPEFSDGEFYCNKKQIKPKFMFRDKIFVKEAFAYIQDPDKCAKENKPEIHYKADYYAKGLYKQDTKDVGIDFLPASKMPKWASRLTIRIRKVVYGGRLWDINDWDCWEEGFGEFIRYENIKKVQKMGKRATRVITTNGIKSFFAVYWNSTHKKPEEKWEANPWVWCYEYEVVR